MVQLDRRHIRRFIGWGVTAGVLVVTFLLVLPGLVGGQEPEVLDLTAGVEAENCAPCHAQLGEANKPGLIFSHGSHLIVSCEACHYRFAHEGGETFTPPMETCFNCHGIDHGPQGELATGACADCHTPAFKLRPNSHVKDWAAKPHAERAKQDTNRCMMCHEAPEDCDKCHADEGLDVGPMPATFLGMLPHQPDRPSVNVYPTEPTSMGQCMYCHPDIDEFMPGRVIFAHAEHLRRNYQCTVCHPTFGHGPESVRRPDMLSCYRCHGLTHASSGLIATEKCEDCHPADFELKPTDHTPAFETGEHKERANKEAAYCAMCHKPEFCVECHAGRKEIAPGKRSAKIIPAAHKNVKWYGDHGGLFLAQEGACGSCHDEASCMLCHKTAMPHPANWLEGHTPDPGVGREDCNVCHTNRDSCQNCHHSKVRNAALIAENCVPCHDQMKLVPATKIQNKGFAEHAVHFKVEEKKGRPYKCYDCHVSFGSSSAARQAEISSAHDLRLCYDCHGTLDFQSRLIAPYKGKQLCLRCHTNLGV